MKPFDLKKFGKALSKANSNIQVGFTDPKIWVSTGNYGLNFAVSGDFNKGFPLEGKMTLLAGESGSSKSYLACGSCVKWCQEHGVQTVILDTERALDGDWVRKIGVDPDADNLIHINVGLIDDITSVVMSFLNQYKEAYKDVPFEEAVTKYKVGDKINVYVVDVKVEKEQVAFSVREYKRKQQRDEISQYMSTANGDDEGAYTLGEMLKSQKND